MGFFNLDPKALLADQVQGGAGNGGGGGDVSFTTDSPLSPTGGTSIPGGTTTTRPFIDFNPTTTSTTTATPAVPINTSNRNNPFAALAGKTINVGGKSAGKLNMPVPISSKSSGSGKTSKSTPSSLDDVSNPSREDFFNEGGKVHWYNSGKGPLGPGLFPVKDPWLDESGRQKYLDAKINRLAELATMAGADKNEIKGLKENFSYMVENASFTGDEDKDEAILVDLESKLANAETPYVESVISDVSTGSAPGTSNSTTTQNSDSVYTPEQIAAIQTAIGQFMEPYAKRAQESGSNGAAILNEIANSGSTSPAYAQLYRSQAAQMQSSGDNIAAAYMRQAQSLPAVQALQNQQALANQVAQLQNQLLAQQGSGVSGSVDLSALLGGAGTGQ